MKIGRITLSRRRIALGVAAILVLALAAFLYQHYDLTPEQIRAAIESSPAWIFLITLLLLPPIGVPLSIFLVATGARFGVGYGSLAAIFAIVGHHFIAFALARLFSSEDRAPTKSASLWKKLEEKTNGNAAKLLLLWGLIPGPPYTIKLYLPLAMGASRLQFVKWNTAGHLIGAVIFVGLGEAILEGKSDLLLILLLCAVALAGGFAFFRKRLLDGKEEEEERESAPEPATTTR